MRLLRAFSGTFVPGVVKIEVEGFGFSFLERLLAGGGRLDYGELTATRLLHKYKLVEVPDARLDLLLQAHVDRECNVCRYFGETQNDVFCFNLDNNHRTDATAIIPETDRAVRSLSRLLASVGCPPLVVASGRGYHVWCRLSGPVENERIHGFMLNAAVRVLAGFPDAELDHRRIKFNFYPDPRTHGVVSLRLFGSLHAKNKVFSNVWTVDGLLGEDDSWEAFGRFVETGAVGLDRFEEAIRAISIG